MTPDKLKRSVFDIKTNFTDLVELYCHNYIHSSDLKRDSIYSQIKYLLGKLPDKPFSDFGCVYIRTIIVKIIQLAGGSLRGHEQFYFWVEINWNEITELVLEIKQKLCRIDATRYITPYKIIDEEYTESNDIDDLKCNAFKKYIDTLKNAEVHDERSKRKFWGKPLQSLLSKIKIQKAIQILRIKLCKDNTLDQESVEKFRSFLHENLQKENLYDVIKYQKISEELYQQISLRMKEDIRKHDFDLLDLFDDDNLQRFLQSFDNLILMMYKELPLPRLINIGYAPQCQEIERKTTLDSEKMGIHKGSMRFGPCKSFPDGNIKIQEMEDKDKKLKHARETSLKFDDSDDELSDHSEPGPWSKNITDQNVLVEKGHDNNYTLAKKSEYVDAMPSGCIGDDVSTRENIAGHQNAKKRKRWTTEEDVAFKKGISMFGSGNWQEIKCAFPIELKDRTSVNLKDRYRTLRNQGNI